MNGSVAKSDGKAISQGQRVVKKRVGERWLACSFESLKPSDVFQIFDNGKLYKTTGGIDTFVADSLPFDQCGILTIYCNHAENQIASPVEG